MNAALRVMSLPESLRVAAPRLTDRVLDAMFADPFWGERFGVRGRLKARADARYHISYLIEALVTDDAARFVTYAQWLRDVLVSRGMCSLHLEQEFVRLAAAIADEHWDGAERAVDVLDRGVRSLRRATGPAAPVDRAREYIVAAAAARAPGTTEHDLAILLSYLGDALAAGSPTRFAAYVSHLVFVGRALGLAASFDALAAGLADELLTADSANALAYLQAARAVLPPPGP